MIYFTHMDSAPIVTPLTPPSTSSKPVTLFIVGAAVIVLLGVGTGYLLAGNSKSESASNSSITAGENAVSSANVFGSSDLETFKDSATGTLQKGGLNGEGTHQLVRDGGPSQTVYLVSSIVDLEEFVGKKVEIHGQTLRARRVGWLMDVGQVKLLE